MITKLKKYSKAWEMFNVWLAQNEIYWNIIYSQYEQYQGEGTYTPISKRELNGLIQEFLDEQGLHLLSNWIWELSDSFKGQYEYSIRSIVEGEEWKLFTTNLFNTRTEAFEAGCKKGFEILEEKL